MSNNCYFMVIICLFIIICSNIIILLCCNEMYINDCNSFLDVVLVQLCALFLMKFVLTLTCRRDFKGLNIVTFLLIYASEYCLALLFSVLFIFSSKYLLIYRVSQKSLS